jgi:hypothetical protein
MVCRAFQSARSLQQTAEKERAAVEKAEKTAAAARSAHCTLSATVSHQYVSYISHFLCM